MNILKLIRPSVPLSSFPSRLFPGQEHRPQRRRGDGDPLQERRMGIRRAHGLQPQRQPRHCIRTRRLFRMEADHPGVAGRGELHHSPTGGRREPSENARSGSSICCLASGARTCPVACDVDRPDVRDFWAHLRRAHAHSPADLVMSATRMHVFGGYPPVPASIFRWRVAFSMCSDLAQLWSVIESRLMV